MLLLIALVIAALGIATTLAVLVLLLALLYEFATAGEVSLFNAARIGAFMGAFFLLAPVAAKAISHLIHRFEPASGVPGLVPTAIVSLVLFFSALAHFMGAPELLGGFAAGLALSRRFFLPFGVAWAIRAGTVWVNTFLVRDLTAPFGGIGASGLGREGGHYALEFHADLKTLQILEGSCR